MLNQKSSKPGLSSIFFNRSSSAFLFLFSSSISLARALEAESCTNADLTLTHHQHANDSEKMVAPVSYVKGQNLEMKKH